MRSLVAIATFTGIFFLSAVASSHERKEIAGMQVVFGGEPEPVLDGEICNLTWRFAVLETEEPVADLEAVTAKVMFEGKAFGPFNARSSRRNPGTYTTQHIFTKEGDGEVTLSFKKAGSDEVLTVSMQFAVRPRKSIEIP